MSKRKVKEIKMSEDQTVEVAAEKKTRKTFVRGPQKVYAVAKLTDPQGNVVDPKTSGYVLEIELSKDLQGVIDALLDGEKAFVQQLEVPKANATEEAATAE